MKVPPGAAWVEVDSDDVHPAWVPHYHETVEDSRLVALTGDFGAFAVGDTIVLPVPQADRVFTPVIEHIQTLVGSNRSFVGRTLGGDSAFSFVVTVGDRNTFAFVDTPAGSYELVGNSRFGWLMPTAGMDTHVDYSKPDYFLPRYEP